MDDKYWFNKWQLNDIAFHEKNVNEDLILYIDSFNLKPGDSIFVPLCGKAKDMTWLAEKGFNVIGVELSPIACSDFFSELNIKATISKIEKFTKYQYKNITLFCGDLFDLTSADLPVISAAYDCKALIALPPDLRKKYVNHIASILGDKIKILLITRESDCHVKPPPYPVNQAEVNELYNPYFNIKLLKCFSVADIPERLIQKGYTTMIESVYLISIK